MRSQSWLWRRNDGSGKPFRAALSKDPPTKTTFEEATLRFRKLEGNFYANTVIVEKGVFYLCNKTPDTSAIFGQFSFRNFHLKQFFIREKVLFPQILEIRKIVTKKLLSECNTIEEKGVLFMQ